MRKDLADSPQARQFFERENSNTARLRHPYVVRILDSGLDPRPAVPGDGVRAGHHAPNKCWRRKAARTERALPMAGRLSRDGGCTQSGIIHRDLKPANLIVVNAGTPTEYVKVMDFGPGPPWSANRFSQGTISGFRRCSRSGTPAYISRSSFAAMMLMGVPTCTQAISSRP